MGLLGPAHARVTESNGTQGKLISSEYLSERTVTAREKQAAETQIASKPNGGTKWPPPDPFYYGRPKVTPLVHKWKAGELDKLIEAINEVTTHRSAAGLSYCEVPATISPKEISAFVGNIAMNSGWLHHHLEPREFSEHFTGRAMEILKILTGDAGYTIRIKMLHQQSAPSLLPDTLAFEIHWASSK